MQLATRMRPSAQFNRSANLNSMVKDQKPSGAILKMRLKGILTR
ncbi:hypothetical protein [Bradyrhizobium sp. CCBAU 051011]|nr:hypothetical protein [Bradyrhizobium sp. CCBAU 051011]